MKRASEVEGEAEENENCFANVDDIKVLRVTAKANEDICDSFRA